MHGWGLGARKPAASIERELGAQADGDLGWGP
jgi:hypothetical protein